MPLQPSRLTRLPFAAPLALILALSIGHVSRAAVTPDEVKKAIEKGRAYLLSKQLPAGRWETPDKRQGINHDWEHMQGDAWGGYTALCTYALLASGEKAQDPKMAAAIDFLKKADIVGIYSIGMRCQVWYLLPPSPQNAADMKKLWQRDLELLEHGINDSGANRGLWDYGDGHGSPDHAIKGRIDHSVSQYGVLGMWALEEAGAEIDNRYWTVLDSVWRAHQFHDGGWVYDGTPATSSPENRPVTASMTAAGVATLFITDDMLHGQEGANCNGNVTDKNIEAGLRWMGEHFDQVKDNYAFYGVERIGVASGYKYLGKVDWYTAGSEYLVKSQHPDGSWTSSEPGAGGLTDTAFALLFLSRGSAPVMLNKLDYRPVAGTGERVVVRDKQAKENAEFPWDQRPRDAANLAKFVGHQTEGDVNWQIVNLNAPVEELHDAPILYISGNRPLKLTDADEAKIKLFVQQGGMVLCNADCPVDASGGPFAKSIRELGTKLFGAEFRQLESSHPLYTEEQFKPSRWKSRQPTVYGLSNGVRELMILLPADAARAWQTDTHVSRVEQFEVGADIYQYATDRLEGGFKGETYLVNAVKPAKRTIKVARLESGENPDPEPAGWPRLDAIMRNQFETGVAAEPVKLGEGKLDGFKIAHLTGTTKFKWRDEQRAELKQFIEKGGTLIVDAAAGSASFADSAEKELNELAAVLGGAPAGSSSNESAAGPDMAGTVLPPDHAVYSLPNARITKFDYRSFTKHRIGGKLNAPRVRGIEFGKRVAVFYSREDLSAGLVGERVDGILGYDPETATAIMRNILFYVDGPPAPPKAEPKPEGKPKPAAKNSPAKK